MCHAAFLLTCLTLFAGLARASDTPSAPSNPQRKTVMTIQDVMQELPKVNAGNDPNKNSLTVAAVTHLWLRKQLTHSLSVPAHPVTSEKSTLPEMLEDVFSNESMGKIMSHFVAVADKEEAPPSHRLSMSQPFFGKVKSADLNASLTRLSLSYLGFDQRIRFQTGVLLLTPGQLLNFYIHEREGKRDTSIIDASKALCMSVDECIATCKPGENELQLWYSGQDLEWQVSKAKVLKRPLQDATPSSQPFKKMKREEEVRPHEAEQKKV